MKPLFVTTLAALTLLSLVTPAQPSGCVVTYHQPSYSYPTYSYKAPSYNYSYPTYSYQAPVVSYIPVATYIPVPYPLFAANYKDYMGMDRKAEKVDAAEGKRDKDILDAINRVGGKMDLVVARVDDLDRRIRIIEMTKLPPVTTPPVSPPPTKPTDPFNPEGKAPMKERAPKVESPKEANVPQMFHNNCASCHDAREANKALTHKDGTLVGYKGGSFVMFVTTYDTAGAAVSAEMARKKGSNVEPLLAPDLKKMRARLAKPVTDDKTMPPVKAHDGTAIAPLSAEDRAAMLAWLDEKIPK